MNGKVRKGGRSKRIHETSYHYAGCEVAERNSAVLSSGWLELSGPCRALMSPSLPAKQAQAGSSVDYSQLLDLPSGRILRSPDSTLHTLYHNCPLAEHGWNLSKILNDPYNLWSRGKKILRTRNLV